MRRPELPWRAATLGAVLLAGCAPEATPPPTETARRPITRGRRATAGDLHATVALTDASGDEANCTGALIAPRLVLTAAHCVVEQDEETDAIVRVFQPNELGVVAGAVDVAQAPAVYAVTQVVLHPEYPYEAEPDHPTGAGRYDDIALLVLSDAVTELPWVEVPDAASAGEYLTAGTELTLTGYGATGPDQDDSGLLYIGEAAFAEQVGQEILVGGPGLTDTCPGDSGGPVYLLGDGEAPWLVGVTSRGVDNSDATCGDGGIYTYAPAHRGWIIDSAGGLFPPSDEPGAGGAGGQGGTGGDDFIDDDEGGGGDDGCSAAPNTPGSGWLAAISLLALRRRRRASAGAC